MTMKMIALLLVLSLFSYPKMTFAQLDSPNAVGVSMGHLHYFVQDIDRSRSFWLEIGAKPVLLGTREVLKFPGVMVLLSQAETTRGGATGSVVSHVAFRVPNVKQMLSRLEKAGYKTELSSSGTGKVGNVYGPAGDKVEFMEDKSVNVRFVPDHHETGEVSPMAVPIALHHIHFYVPDREVVPMKEWYVDMFGAIPGVRYKTKEPPYEAADLPGVNLNFSAYPDQKPTQGRHLDHIGFEIENLEEFCNVLEKKGLEFDRPYRTTSTGLGVAYFTDPWGVYIELTEGLDRL